MKRIKRTFAAVIALLLILTSLTAVSVFAEGENTEDPEESSSVIESSSSVEEESSSSVEEKSSSSAEEKSSSSSEEKSSSSSEESSSSSEEESASSEQEERTRSSSSSSSAEEAYVQTLTHDLTGISIGLSQPNDKLLIDAKSISADDTDYSDVYAKLLGASKDKELVCCYEVLLGGDESFNSKVTIMLPVDESLIGRSMVVLFYPDGATRVETSNKNVSKAVSQSSSEASADSEEDADELSGSGVIKVSETLEAGRKYYFAVCEFADFVPASNGFGLLEIMAILVGIAALASGGLLAFLWIRYNKKQAKKK